MIVSMQKKRTLNSLKELIADLLSYLNRINVAELLYCQKIHYNQVSFSCRTAADNTNHSTNHST
jgi:hypothetical protein